MAQNQQNEKFRVVVTNTATGEIELDATESTVVVATSNIAEVTGGEEMTLDTFLNGTGTEIAQLIANSDNLYKCALLAQLINAMKSAEKEDAE